MIDCDSQTCNGCYWYDADTGVCSKTESSPEIEGIKEYCRKEGGKNMDKKICPILSKYVWEGAGHVDTGLHDVECREEKCAWWDDERGKCAIEEKRFKPKKPIYDCMKLLYICPNCGEFLQTYNEHQKYSMCCGQLLDWD